jgi:hypothetical protein
MPSYRKFPSPHALSGALQEFLRTDAGSDFTSLIERFPSVWKTFAMGGMVRDLFLSRVVKVDAKPADMDLVIFGASSVEEIKSKLGNVSHSTNAFGGVKCRLQRNGMVFDLWRVEDHTNMASAPKPHTIEQLLRHNLLDIDAILWEPETDCLHDCGCIKAIEAGCIGLMGPEGISERFLAVQVAHVLVVAYKTGFPLSDDLRSFVIEASERFDPAEVEKVLERKMPLAAAQIELFWNDLLSGGVRECPAPRAIIP